MEFVDNTINGALKTWQTSSTGRTRESPLWSHDPWTHRSREAAGRPEKNELFWSFQKVLIISEKSWSSWKGNLQGETETWSPGTDFQGAHSVCHPHLGRQYCQGFFLTLEGLSPPFFGKSIFLEVLTSAASIIQEVQLLHWASDINNSWIQVWSLIFILIVSKTLLMVYLTLILEITLAARSPFVGPTISHSSRLAWLIIFVFI